ncbi:MAG: cobyrinate a,c-diamide synthase, partial [Pseudomonas sp.]|nr:cobyrinate a,c-diamide synthase [Pseudomonas sp.]
VHFYFPSNPGAVAALFAPDLETAIAGKPAPTGECIPNVGGGLPPMRP